MAYSKTFLLLGLVLAVLLISSAVSARELAETQENMQLKSVEEAKYGGHGYGYEHGHEHDHGHGHPGHGGHPRHGGEENMQLKSVEDAKYGGHGYGSEHGHGHEHGHEYGHGHP
ncbi:hypothetical protein CsSME_00018181 [Camellia sinensis var. sinensis]